MDQRNVSCNNSSMRLEMKLLSAALGQKQLCNI